LKIYRLKPNLNNYQDFSAKERSTLDLYPLFNGTPIPSPLPIIETVISPDDFSHQEGDFPGLASHIPVFSRRAVDSLGKPLYASGQVIPISVDNQESEYFAVNITRLINGLDLQKSQVKRFQSSGRIMRVLRYEFIGDLVRGVDIFKIPETGLKDVYVSENFVNQVIKSRLTGFAFELLWTDEPYLILCPYCMGIIEEGTTCCPTCGLDPRNDAAFELSLDELYTMKKRQCEFCGTKIRVDSMVCPYCKQGKSLSGEKSQPAIV